MRNYDLVAFDFDGTLFDSDLALVKIALKMSESYLVKKDLNIDDLLFINGPSLDESLPLIFPGVDIKELRAKYQKYAPEHAKDIVPFKNVRTLLDTLKEDKVKLAIFTSRARASTELILKQNGLFAIFDMIVCGDDGFKKKPSGEGLKHILDTFNVEPERALFVGDNWRDVVAGADVGVGTVFIKPYRRVHKLDVKSHYVVNDIIEVLEVVYKDGR